MKVNSCLACLIITSSLVASCAAVVCYPIESSPKTPAETVPAVPRSATDDRNVEAIEIVKIVQRYWEATKQSQDAASLLASCTTSACSKVTAAKIQIGPAIGSEHECARLIEGEARAYVEYVNGWRGIVGGWIQKTGTVAGLPRDIEVAPVFRDAAEKCFQRVFQCRHPSNVCWSNKVADALLAGENGRYARPLLVRSTCSVLVDSESIGPALCEHN